MKVSTFEGYFLMKQNVNVIAASHFAVARTNCAYPDTGEFANHYSIINDLYEILLQSIN